MPSIIIGLLINISKKVIKRSSFGGLSVCHILKEIQKIQPWSEASVHWGEKKIKWDYIDKQYLTPWLLIFCTTLLFVAETVLNLCYYNLCKSCEGPFCVTLGLYWVIFPFIPQVLYGVSSSVLAWPWQNLAFTHCYIIWSDSSCTLDNCWKKLLE